MRKAVGFLAGAVVLVGCSTGPGQHQGGPASSITPGPSVTSSPAPSQTLPALQLSPRSSFVKDWTDRHGFKYRFAFTWGTPNGDPGQCLKDIPPPGYFNVPFSY